MTFSYADITWPASGKYGHRTPEELVSALLSRGVKFAVRKNRLRVVGRKIIPLDAYLLTDWRWLKCRNPRGLVAAYRGA